MKAVSVVATLAALWNAPAQAVEKSYPFPSTRLRGANVVDLKDNADLKLLAKTWKANSMRLLVEEILESKPPYAVKKEALEKSYKTVDEALKQGLYVVYAPSVGFENHDAFFGSPEFRASFKEFTRELATRFKDYPDGIAYDLMNEPHDDLARTEWPKYAHELTEAIRAIDPRHPIVVEPAAWGWPDGFDGFEPTGDKNTIYSFHFYGPMDFSHQRGYDAQGKFAGHMKATDEEWKARKYPGGHMQGEIWDRAKLEKSLAKAFAWGKKHGATIWCGEFGTARWANGAKTWYSDMIEILESNKIGWSYYAFREWAPMDIEMDPVVRGQDTVRGNTELVRLFRKHFGKNSRTAARR